jgi:hypothetical protein
VRGDYAFLTGWRRFVVAALDRLGRDDGRGRYRYGPVRVAETIRASFSKLSDHPCQ